MDWEVRLKRGKTKPRQNCTYNEITQQGKFTYKYKISGDLE